jgi:uncharacterized membrane protein YkvA (DUF1232 family)
MAKDRMAGLSRTGSLASEGEHADDDRHGVRGLAGGTAMSEELSNPFSKAEMEAMRRAARDEPGLRQDFWTKLKRIGRHLPFAEDLVAAYYCTLDPATPSRVKLILLGAIAYFVMPFDAVADFLPVVGFADDAALIAAAIAQVAGSITEAHREKARETLRDPEDGSEPARDP